MYAIAPSSTVRLGAVLLMVSVAFGCSTVGDPVRRSVLVPGPSMPSVAGKPVGAGGLRLAGEVSAWSQGVETRGELSEGAPAVWVPRARYGASLTYGAGRLVSIGSSFEFARVLWSDPSSSDIARFENPSLPFWQWDFAGRLHVPTGVERLDASVMFELGFTRMPEVVRVCGQSVCDSPADYSFRRHGWRSRARPTVAIELGGEVLPWLYVYGVGGYQHTWRNDGQQSVDEFISDSLFVMGDNVQALPYFLGGLGVEATVSVVSLGGTLLVPVRSSYPVDLSPTFVVRVGLVFPTGKGG